MQINALMSGTAWNLKKMMEILKEKAKRLFWQIFIQPFFQNLIPVIIQKSYW
jgi:hypothetical protein